MAHNVLYIAAKAPRPGLVKTRLGRTIGHDAAVLLYRAFLRDLGARFAAAPFALGWYITPPGSWPELAPLVGGAGTRVLAQAGADWTERQQALFAGAAARGEERVVLLASDSPQVTVGQVAHAFAQLERHELVFGPVYDGGYYLIGMRGWHDVLRDVPMSTGTVLQEIVARARQAGCSVGWVAPTFDVDEAHDLVYLHAAALNRPDLAATRAALRQAGLLFATRAATAHAPAAGTGQQETPHGFRENLDPAERAFTHGD
jgi:rSAM/selenodomain-associated transferase 1